MTTSPMPPGPPGPGGGQPGTPPAGAQGPSPGRGTALPWLVGGAVVVIAAVVMTLVLVLGGDEDTTDGDADTAGGGTGESSGDGPDLSTPETAAQSFLAAIKDGDAEAVLDMACVGVPACVDRHGPPDVTDQQVQQARDTLAGHLGTMAEQIGDAKFVDVAREGSEPGTMEVPYRTPDMSEDEHAFLSFIQVDGDWLYYGSGGGASASAPPQQQVPPEQSVPGGN